MQKIDSDHLRVIKKACLLAGSYLKKQFFQRKNREATHKETPGDLLTRQDLCSEKIIIDLLSKYFPNTHFLSEEMAETSQGKDYWIIDPIDGTTNFFRRVPHFSVSIAYWADGRVQCGAIYDPLSDEMFSAEEGRGAYCNGERISVSSVSSAEEACVATGTPFPGMPGNAQFISEMSRMVEAVGGIRRLGSASLDLAYVSCGRFDLYWERHVKMWDIAAGIRLVQEAGGAVDCIAIEKSAFRILASNKAIHALAKSILHW